MAALSEFMRIDPQIKDAADQYLSAANILNDRGAFSGVLLPQVINAVFSIELYLKALNSKKVYNQGGSGSKWLNRNSRAKYLWPRFI